jgi:hypothetical protein
MSFKKKHDASSLQFPSFSLPFRLCSLILTVFFLLLVVNSLAQTIDRIVAIVNDQVITLTDLRIAEAFGLYENELEGEGERHLFSLLERMINQKIVLDATSEDISVEEGELETELLKVVENFGPEEFQKRLEDFGLRLEDLRAYLEEKILYQHILSRRFGQGITVSLEEIESHYKNTYLPSQEKRGLKPRPMMEILGEMELAIKQEKIKKQIVDWINNLKKQAEVEIRLDDLNQIENREYSLAQK